MTSFKAAPSGHEFTTQRHWSAQLSAMCQIRRGKTVLTKLDFNGPLNLKSLLYPEPAYQGVLPAEAIVLHPPGGLVSGDDLKLDLTAQDGARLLVTTPAATKVYGVDHNAVPQRQMVNLTITDSVLEYLPAETIVFNRAQAHLGLNVDLSGTGTFIGSETVVLGRKVGAQPFTHGAISQHTEIKRDGHLLFHENLKLRLPRDESLLHSACGFGGKTVLSTFYAIGPNVNTLNTMTAARCKTELNASVHGSAASSEAVLKAGLNAGLTAELKTGFNAELKAANEVDSYLIKADLAALTAELNSQGYSVTLANEVFVGRLLTDSAAAAERWMLDLWAKVRPVLTGMPARTIRIKNC